MQEGAPELTLTRMIKALAFLLEKDAKNRRESVSQDVSFPNLRVLFPICVLLVRLFDAKQD
jgi:hypothetical protein